MTKFTVTIVLITGYYGSDYDNPKLRQDTFEVEANTEKEAVEKAKELDKTGFSIWETYADEIYS